MKIKTLNIVAIMLIMLVVVIAGCTSKSPSSANSTSASGSSATSSSSQQVGSTVNSSSVFGTNYNWIQYQVTGNFRGNETQTNTKIERSMGDYKGTQAVHLKITSTSSRGRDMVSDIYYDKDKNSILGGTTTMTFNGQTRTREIPAIQLSGQGFNNFNEEATLTFEGTESVTVPAGTYPSASKYTKSVNETTVTYWAASGVPVPVKEMTSSPRGSSNMELVGWG
jgi:hypothetical protein